MSSPQLCFVLHANGLCKDVWAPFVEDLARHLRVEVQTVGALDLKGKPGVRALLLGANLHLVLVDLLGHGAAPCIDLNGEFTDWMQFAVYLSELLSDCIKNMPEEPSEILAVGHSLGGGSALLTQGFMKNIRFARMVLFEPMYLFVDEKSRKLAGIPEKKQMESPLVQRTLKRMAEWPTHSEAVASLSGKPFFASWDPRALRGYLEGGLVGHEPVKLACAPATEGNLFASGVPPVLLEVLSMSTGDGLKGCELHVAMGSKSHVPWTQKVASVIFGNLQPKIRISVVDGGHMWPVEKPAQFASFVAESFGWSKGTSRL